jgi:hypothetical protein
VTAIAVLVTLSPAIAGEILQENQRLKMNGLRRDQPRNPWPQQGKTAGQVVG